MLRGIIIGPPGSGKGTHCHWMTKAFNLKHLSSGDILREEITSGTSIGLMCAEKMQRGELVDDELIVKLIVARIPSEGGFLLDGFPRTLSQAKILANHATIDFVISLECPDDLIIKRICGRWTHPGSGRSYHEKYSPPNKTITDVNGEIIRAYDDVTNEPLVRRADDTEESVKTRIETFRRQTKPVLEYYDNIHKVDSADLESAKAQIRTICETLLKG